MWQGYRDALALYHNIMIEEWIQRGYNNTMVLEEVGDNIEFPPWINGPIHASHRSNLLRKDQKYYSKFGWEEPNNLPYVWPS